MARGATGLPAARTGARTADPRHRRLMRRTLLYLSALYLAPFLLLTVYFHFQSRSLRDEARRLHVQSIAEYQANMLDLFIRERAVNLANLIRNPGLAGLPTHEALQAGLDDLRRGSPSFVDLGVFDRRGVQVSYVGPYPVLENRDYGEEEWFRALQGPQDDFVLTDIYLGFRGRPHFTIAVSRRGDGPFLAMRATLDPEKLYEFITSLEGAREVHTAIVNEQGTYQVVTPNVGTPLAESAIVPPPRPRVGSGEIRLGGSEVVYGYAWLEQARWALIAQRTVADPAWLLGGDPKVAAVASGIILMIVGVIVVRARRTVRLEEERDQSRAQLEHAAKLASVGELAAGIAHEINNPLAIIGEEVGLMQDLMDPRFGQVITFDDLRPGLQTIKEAVFRGRDITRKLLGFVRRSEFSLARHDVAALMDTVLDGFLAREMRLANIQVERRYEPDLPAITTDGNQLEQVFLNLLNNAVDAMAGAGRLTITIRRRERRLQVLVSDTGTGMTREQVQKIFMPFFTTKEVGKGTGLGLSVSYGIVQGLGGTIEVESEPGRGSTFTVSLPIR